MPSNADIIARIDEKIYAILNDPDTIASYRLGNKMVSRAEILRELRATRQAYQEIAIEEPYENIRHIALDWDEAGADISELIGDDTG